GRPPAADPGTPPALTPAATVAEGFRHIIRTGIAHILANTACVLAGSDPEGVHQIRLALRRLRSAFTVFAPAIGSPEAAELVDGLRWLSERLAPARDRLVLAERFFRPFAAAHPGLPGLDSLAGDLAAASAAATAQAADALRRQQFTALLLRLGAWLESGRWQHGERSGPESAADAVPDRPLAELAGPWLELRAARLHKAGRPLAKSAAGERGAAGLDAAGRHRLRLRVKRLRDAAGFFRGLYPPASVRGWLDAAEPLQTALGEINDADVARRLVAAAARRETHAAAAALDAWIKAAGRNRRSELPRRWRDFATMPPFWTKSCDP
ncbi:MAG TPA: CHAD domain-containing protein, partial [Acetobacteraceae bacterium]